MNKIEFAKQKIEKANNLLMELKYEREALEALIKCICEINIDRGNLVEFDGNLYEIIDIRFPQIFNYSEIGDENLKYKVLCLKTIDGKKIVNNKYASNIRNKKMWHQWDFSTKNTKARKFHADNTIVLENLYSNKFN